MQFALVPPRRCPPCAPRPSARLLCCRARLLCCRSKDPRVLWVHYEDLHEDLAAGVKLIAEFLGLGAGDAELQALAVHQAGIDFMKQHPTSEEGC